MRWLRSLALVLLTAVALALAAVLVMSYAGRLDLPAISVANAGEYLASSAGICVAVIAGALALLAVVSALYLRRRAARRFVIPAAPSAPEPAVPAPAAPRPVLSPDDVPSPLDPPAIEKPSTDGRSDDAELLAAEAELDAVEAEIALAEAGLRQARLELAQARAELARARGR